MQVRILGADLGGSSIHMDQDFWARFEAFFNGFMGKILGSSSVHTDMNFWARFGRGSFHAYLDSWARTGGLLSARKSGFGGKIWGFLQYM